MSHEIETMMAVGERPWHGRGTLLQTPPATVAEALKLAGLDWEIKLEQCFLADGTPVERKAVLRVTDRAQLGTVGMDWHVVQNAKAFEPFQPFLDAKVATIESAGSLKGGRRVWMLAKVDRPDSIIVPKADDRVAKYLLVAIGHDGTLTFRLGYSPTRVVCWNTLSVALSEGEETFVRIRHTSGAVKAIELLTQTIAAVDARFEKVAEVFRALAGVAIRNEKQLRQYIDAVFPPPLKKEETPDGKQLLAGLLNGKTHDASRLPSPFSPEGGDMTTETKRRVYEDIARLFEFGKGNTNPGVAGTAWAAYNAVTEYNTWERGRNVDNRLDNVWLNQNGPVAKALPAAIATFLS